MSLKFVFWFFMLLWVLFIGWHGYSTGWGLHLGNSFLPFVLFLVLGLKTFGGPIEG